MIRFIFSLLVSFISLGRLIAAEQSAPLVGRIVMAEGSIQAVNPNRETRTLTKKSPIFLQDTIEVGSDSMAGLEMADGSLITLVANTEYQITSFVYKKSSQGGSFTSELTKGGLRMLSGNIGKSNPEQYEVKTENATIGLLGTVVEALLQEDTLFVHVNKGRAKLTNQAGTVTIGTGTVEYAVVSRFDELPQTLISRPAQLTPHYFVPQVRPRGGH